VIVVQLPWITLFFRLAPKGVLANLSKHCVSIPNQILAAGFGTELEAAMQPLN